MNGFVDVSSCLVCTLLSLLAGKVVEADKVEFGSEMRLNDSSH